MSVETVTWAKLQVCGDAYAKAVLLELANWAKPDGICEFRRVRDIANVIEVSTRTVQRALKRLEDSRSDNGLGLIRRISRHRVDGGQQANSFQLVGYVYPNDRQSFPRVRQSQPGCPIVGDGDDAAVTPKKNQESNLIESPKSPPSVRRFRRAITDDWIAPPAHKLPSAAHALAGQWPEGAYESEAEAFFQYSSGTGLRSADWNAKWAARVQAQHLAVMRASKAGIQFPVKDNVIQLEKRALPIPEAVRAQSLEDERSTRLREVLRTKVPEQMWTRLFEPAAYLFDEPGLTVWVSTSFAREEFESRYHQMVRLAAQLVAPDTTWVRTEIEPLEKRNQP